MTSLAVHNEILGGVGVVRRQLARVICPACGQQVEAVASNGQVKGYCAIAKRYVDFPIESRGMAETSAEALAEVTPIRTGRNSKGHFIKGNVPWNKKG